MKNTLLVSLLLVFVGCNSGTVATRWYSDNGILSARFPVLWLKIGDGIESSLTGTSRNYNSVIGITLLEEKQSYEDVLIYTNKHINNIGFDNIRWQDESLAIFGGHTGIGIKKNGIDEHGDWVCVIVFTTNINNNTDDYWRFVCVISRVSNKNRLSGYIAEADAICATIKTHQENGLKRTDQTSQRNLPNGRGSAKDVGP